jgi:aldehyde:ferredoxin oxidoreductase
VPLQFGNAEAYRQAAFYLGTGANEFYRLLGQGSLKAAAQHGGADFACVLGQEMAGYATGEVFFAAQSLSFRHSHLDCGGYAYDQQHEEQNVEDAVDFLIEDEVSRLALNCMVSCLFARGVYTSELLARCLHSVGYANLAANLDAASRHVQQLRWQTRFATGYDMDAVTIPKRFFKVKTWKGAIDPQYLHKLRQSYAGRIAALGRQEK